MKRICSILALVVAGALSFSSCVKKSFDPPADMSHYDPQLKVTHTIEQLKAMNGAYVSNVNYDTTLITDDVVVSGVVVADDRSGNYFKQIVIQDSTGGIAISINAYSLYNDYPVGRKIYVKCKGMYLGYDGGLPVMGGSVSEQKAINGLDGSDINKRIVKADIGHVVKDTVITLAQARTADPFFYNRLVTVTDIEFVDTTKTFTEPSATTNRYVTNCVAAGSTSQLVVRTSNYANFHAMKLPVGHGSITGILTVYQTSTKTAQLIIRTIDDVKLTVDRCNPFANSLFLESFGSNTSGEITLAGWTNYAEAGNVKWQFGNAGTNVANKPYAQVTAFNSGQDPVVSWLITPGISLAGTTTPKLNFISADGRDNGASLKVFVSTNYTPGSAPNTASWTLLNPTISSGNTGGFGAFISSGDVDLSAYVGQTVCVAFKYVGADPSSGTKKTTTFEIDDVNISKN